MISIENVEHTENVYITNKYVYVGVLFFFQLILYLKCLSIQIYHITFVLWSTDRTVRASDSMKAYFSKHCRIMCWMFCKSNRKIVQTSREIRFVFGVAISSCNQFRRVFDFSRIVLKTPIKMKCSKRLNPWLRVNRHCY